MTALTDLVSGYSDPQGTMRVQSRWMHRKTQPLSLGAVRCALLSSRIDAIGNTQGDRCHAEVARAPSGAAAQPGAGRRPA